MEVDKDVVENEKPQSDVMPTIQIPPSFTQRLQRKEEGDKFKKFIANLSILSINFPLLKAIQEIPRYAKIMKKFMSKKKLIEGDKI